MTIYIVHYSTGTSRHDERYFTQTIVAKNLADAGTRADRIALKQNGVVTSITRSSPTFK